MEQEHTPAEIRPNRTVFRFTREEAIFALANYVVDYGDAIVPKGKRFVSVPDRDGSDNWTLTLGVDHDDPPPPPKDA